VSPAEREALAGFLDALASALMAPEGRLLVRRGRLAGYCAHLAAVCQRDGDVLGPLQTAEALLREAASG
jgi:hypothetical protein